MPKNGVIESGCMHTPTTTMRLCAGATRSSSSIMPGHADGLEHGHLPAAADAAPRLRTASRSRGSTTSSAPIVAPRARRAGEKSAATIGATPSSLQGGDDGEADRAAPDDDGAVAGLQARSG